MSICGLRLLAQVPRFLRNRGYLGEISFRDVRHQPDEALIDPALFDKAQILLAERGESYDRRSTLEPQVARTRNMRLGTAQPCCQLTVPRPASTAVLEAGPPARTRDRRPGRGRESGHGLRLGNAQPDSRGHEGGATGRVTWFPRCRRPGLSLTHPAGCGLRAAPGYPPCSCGSPCTAPPGTGAPCGRAMRAVPLLSSRCRAGCAPGRSRGCPGRGCPARRSSPRWGARSLGARRNRTRRGRRASVRSCRPPSPEASMSRNAPRRGDPSSVLIAAKLLAAARTDAACWGTSRRARRTARTASPPARAMSGISGPSTAPETQRRQGGQDNPGELPRLGSRVELEVVGRGRAAPPGQVPDGQPGQHAAGGQDRHGPPRRLGGQAEPMRKMSEDLFLQLADQGQEAVGGCGDWHAQQRCHR